MDIRKALAYSGKAVGCVKCTYATLFVKADNVAKNNGKPYIPVYTIQNGWYAEKEAYPTYIFQISELADLSAYCKNDSNIFGDAIEYEEGNAVVNFAKPAIVAISDDQNINDNFVKVEILAEVFTALDESISRDYQAHLGYYNRAYAKFLEDHPGYEKHPEWYPDAKVPQFVDYDITLSPYYQVLLSLKQQIESGNCLYVKKYAIDWYPDIRRNNEADGENNPYEYAYTEAAQEEDRLRKLLLAAGAASLL